MSDPILLDGAVLVGCGEARVVLRELLGAGAHGRIYRACVEQSCDTAVKIQLLRDANAAASFRRESELGMRAAERGYGPRVFLACIVPASSLPAQYLPSGNAAPVGASLGVIVSERYDGSLDRLGVARWCTENVENAKRVRAELHALVARLHADRVVHADLLPKNVLYRADPSSGRITAVTLTDWGLGFTEQSAPNEAHLRQLFAYNLKDPAQPTWSSIQRRPQLRDLTLDDVKQNPFLLDAPMLALVDDCVEFAATQQATKEEPSPMELDSV